MSDLISRSALIAEYDRVHKGPAGGARKLMEDAPDAESKYAWHDLRKNPEDLPKDVGNSYVVCYKLWNELHYGIFGYRTSFDFKGVHFCSYDSEYGDAVIDDAIAWREIEPFMEGEE